MHGDSVRAFRTSERYFNGHLSGGDGGGDAAGVEENGVDVEGIVRACRGRRAGRLARVLSIVLLLVLLMVVLMMV